MTTRPACLRAFSLALALPALLLPTLAAETPGATRDGGVKLSGVAETTAFAGHSPLGGWYSGFEQFANVRLTAPVGEIGTFNAAANLLASAGTENSFSAEGEFERLYVSFRAGRFDVDAGLMRVPFGYAHAFRPTDILNAANPLHPDARLAGVLGALGAWYVGEETRLAAFVSDRAAVDAYDEAGSVDPLSDPGSRPLGGLMFETHSPRYSAQVLLAARAPESDATVPEIRAGASLKVEAVVGLVADALLFTDGTTAPSARGASSWVKAAVGADYSFLDGELYVLGQYYYNGARVPAGEVSDFYRRHYLFANLLWKASDYTRAGLSALVSLEDGSFAPTLDFEHDLTRGVVLSAEGRAFIDAGDLGLGRRGEFGSAGVGTTATFAFKATVRF